MQKEIISRHQLEVTLQRLACQLVENHRDFSSTVLVGIQRRGVVLAHKIGEILRRDYGIEDLKIGTLDVTFFRDDFRRRESPAHANTTSILFPDTKLK